MTVTFLHSPPKDNWAEINGDRSKDERYKSEYDALDEEFQLARALIEARTRAGLSQTQLARRRKTSQSYVARVTAPSLTQGVAVSAR